MRHSHHLRMAVVRIVMADIKMTADALKVQLVNVLLIVEMSGDSVIRYAFRKKVYVALDAGLIVDDAGGIGKLAL